MRIEQSSLGRIVVPDSLPSGFGLYYTTRDFHGRIDDVLASQLTGVIRDRFGLTTSLTTCNQVHGATVRRAGAARPDSSPSSRLGMTWRECDSCDALWSSERGAALAIKVADCLPVTLIDPESQIIANIHSGWRGAVQQITTVTVDTVLENTRFDPARSFAYLGPTIRVCCFEVGEEVAARFDSEDVERGKARPHVDIPKMTMAALRRRGFAESRIFDSGLCTRCEGSIFHSFRRDGTGGGRNLAVVAQ